VFTPLQPTTTTAAMSYLLDPDSPESIPDLSSSQGSNSRRIRPPDPYLETGEATRVPLRLESVDKARKRESRLGLRHIFGRTRGASDASSAPVSPRDAPPSRSGGLRASLAEINWPYGLHPAQGHRSEVSLASFPKSLPVGQSLRHKKSESIVRQPTNPEGIAAWSPPPLFQAYPQAIKHAHLPACTVSADVVLRLHTHKSSGSLAGLLSPTPDIAEEMAAEKPKRRHKRNGSGSASRFEWTSKVFVLATSGHLLQYAGAGTFDRLPEKVLQLGKDSAAFASDAIPGRHWVIQVSAVAEPDRSPTSHSSLRSRLPFRGQERRHSSTFLMVFESAEEMDGWIAILRREIETLGGRKVVSETGRPKSGDEEDAQLRSQASQRTLVTRDPDRFSRVMTPDDTWVQSQGMSSPDINLEPTRDDLARDQSFDDTSTASFISHEGRQLDRLRDSANRLSYVSSGQRTMITSVGSSPACSPIRDSFGDFESMAELHEHEAQSQPRLRPNAMAIIDRRQSLQTINHVFEMGVASAQALRPVSTLQNSGQPDAASPPAPAPQPMPNFSVPQSANKRHSFARNPLGMPPTHVTSSPLLARMSARRPPPSALSINPRPLSLVEDHPSPALTASPALSALSRAGTGASGSPLSAGPIITPVSLPPPQRAEMMERRFRDESIRDSGISTHERPSSGPQDGDSKGYYPRRSPMVPPLELHNIPRSSTSLGMYGDPRPAPPAPVKQGTRARRLSFTSSQQGERRRHLSPPPQIRPELFQRPLTPSLKAMPRSSQHLRLDSQAQSQAQPQRRSMSHLPTEGPPPAPPPNRALPPLPPKARFMNAPPPGFI
jgi:hypothetical protein